MDYIFDWARDLYRPSIHQLLEYLSDNDFDDQGSLATDNDIFSSRMTVSDDMSSDAFHQISTPGEELLFGWKKLDILGYRHRSKVDILECRPTYVVKYVFTCLFISRDNFGTLLTSLGTNPEIQKSKIRSALMALRQSPLKTADHILSQMEDNWTGTPRLNQNVPTSRDLFVSIAFHTIISQSWEIQKVLTCFATDQDALNNMRVLSRLTSKSASLEGLESDIAILDESTLVRILEEIRGRSVSENMRLAFSNRAEELGPPRPPARTGVVNVGGRKQLKAFVPRTRQWRKPSLEQNLPICLNLLIGDSSSNLRNTVVRIYKVLKQLVMLEPSCHYLRSSSRFEEVKPLSSGLGLPESYQKLIPSQIRGMQDGFFLVCNASRSERHLCLYLTSPSTKEPSSHKLLSAIRTCIDKNFLSIFDRKHWHRQLMMNLQLEELDGLDNVSKDEPDSLAPEFFAMPFASIVTSPARGRKRSRMSVYEKKASRRRLESPLQPPRPTFQDRQEEEEEEEEEEEGQEKQDEEQDQQDQQEENLQPESEIITSESIEEDEAFRRDILIAQILSEAEGDSLSQEQMACLISLGHFT
ncbi:hypothetical protein EG329_000937 [Mollisiaceae sp. DMI_Dod_QoI]|nr:hypothetical protein EG329_000937 [Helotiales sp. DMI_Dod_QoI]